MTEALASPLVNTEAERQMQRRYDFVTQMAELVEGVMSTEFEVYPTGTDLIGEDGRSLDQITAKGCEDARRIAAVNPERWFEVRRSNLERQELPLVLDMAAGKGPNTLVIVSDCPEEVIAAGKHIGGYNSDRKQTMLRIFTYYAPTKKMKMYVRSLDGSNRQALEAIYTRLNFGAQPGELLGQRMNIDLPHDRQLQLADELRDVYDQSLSEQFGGEWHGGRSPVDMRNTYEFVMQQTDLIDECLRLDKLGWLNQDFLYNVAATMNKRFAAAKAGDQAVSEQSLQELHQEIIWAGDIARALGITFSACGDSFGPGSSLFEQAGYGKSSSEDQYGPLSFKCSNGHWNERPYGSLIPYCHTCGVSVRC